MNSYIKLGIAALIPVVASVIFYLLEEKTAFKKLPYWARQLIIGIVFGCIAIVGTEWGIPMNGAQVNCRDAAPLCAGLLFGAPAGLIAGFIGATERWFAVYWGVGTFTRIACSLATLIAGVYAALLRKFLFENRRPSWTLAFVAGIIIEVLHLSLVFVTNMDNSTKAALVVESCTAPLIIATSCSVLVATICVAIIAKDKLTIDRENLRISQTIQRWLLLCVLLAFIITTGFLYMVQTGIAESEATTLLTQGLGDATISGNVVAIGQTGTIVVQSEEQGEYFDLSNIETATTTKTTYNDEDVFIMYKYDDNHYIIGVLPCAEAYETRDVSLYINTFMEILVFAVMFLLIYALIKRVVVNKMKKVNDSLVKITDGDLDEIVDVHDNKEFQLLSNGINETVTSLKHYISEAEARIDAELELARNIQFAALPELSKHYTDRAEFDIYAMTDPAKEVGGDFYDFYYTKDDNLNFEIADVSGKGIPAAMFMMKAKTQLKSLAENDMSVEKAMTLANKSLCEGNDANMFVTAWLASVDLEEGWLEFTNAGHNAPVSKRGDNPWRFIKNTPGFILGGLETAKYRKGEYQLKPGDMLFLYTDGVTEATNENNELFGDDRLIETLNKIPDGASMKEICEFIHSEVDKFAGTAPQFDDITMVAVRYNGPKDKIEIHFDEAEIANVTPVTEFIEEELGKLDCPMKTIVQLNIAIDEIYSNIVKYAYKNKKGPVTVRLEERHNPHGVCLTFIDEGIPYNPLNADPPDTTLSAEEREIGGLGIYMVKESMDNIVYEYKYEQNILHLFKEF